MNFNLADGSYYACLFLDNGHLIEQGPIRFTDGSPATGDAITEWHMNGTLRSPVIPDVSALVSSDNGSPHERWTSGCLPSGLPPRE